MNEGMICISKYLLFEIEREKCSIICSECFEKCFSLNSFQISTTFPILKYADKYYIL